MEALLQMCSSVQQDNPRSNRGTTTSSETHPGLFPSKIFFPVAKQFSLGEQSRPHPKTFPTIPCNGEVRSISTSSFALLTLFYHAEFLTNIDTAPTSPALHANLKHPSAEATFHLLVIKGLNRVHKDEQKFLQNPIFLGAR